jgi:pyruvate-formate lyase-activating enzyme
MMNAETEPLWHVTVLSNFVRGFEKYSRLYSKARIPESAFPDRFFLLAEDEMRIGVSKAGRLLAKLNVPGNRLIALQTRVAAGALKANARTGLGRYVESPEIRVEDVAFVEEDGAVVRRIPSSVEEMSALSLRLAQPDLAGYGELRPRSFSVLPIARGCQASCPFCFSEASASAEQEQARLDLGRVAAFARAARQRGAERFVITGGGEPGLVRDDPLCELISAGSEALGKSVLITNGHHLAGRAPEELQATLRRYSGAGLNVLAISRHHHDDDTSARLMQLRTNVAAVAGTWHTHREHWPKLRLRFTCVLQRGGVDSLTALESYVDWAAAQGVPELCFKELYVSTSAESVYHRHAANAWSHANQVPLALVLEFAARHGFAETARLPWGAPVFSGVWRGRTMRIAAYTEPSLFWERTQRIARSWNLMADGRCLASLEDRASEIQLPTAA